MQTLLNGEKIVNLDARNQVWERTRERGEAAYVLRDVLIACSSLCIIQVGYEAYGRHITLSKMLLDSISPALEGLFVGFVTGIWGWNSNESRYQKALAEESSANEILKDQVSSVSQRGRNGII